MILLMIVLLGVTVGCALGWHDQPAPREKDNC